MKKLPPTPIDLAVLPLKEQAMERARKYAAEYVRRAYEEIAAADGDLNVAAPYPKLTSVFYRQEAAKHHTYLSLTKEDKDKPRHIRMNDPNFRVPDYNRKYKFVEQAVKDAAAQYDAYMAKLNAKIGPVVSATLAGNHVWSESILTVVTEAGSTERWHTQMILNTSKYHKLFNQFPTRKLKESAK